jgi:hypothetical protein
MRLPVGEVVMKRWLALGVMLGLMGLFPARAADVAAKEEVKEKLRELQDYIGGWKGSGGPDKPRAGPREATWDESLDWSWRFKGDDAWLSLQVKGGKFYQSGQMRYLPEKKLYQLTLVDKNNMKLAFEGTIKNDTLTLQRQDSETKATQQVTMSVAAEGVRFIYRMAHKEEGKTYWVKDFMVACTKEGESLGKTEKKNECIVSGGVGTMPVTYKGETFYVCCSGCRDAFNENPEKYINEFKAKKAGKQ